MRYDRRDFNALAPSPLRIDFDVEIAGLMKGLFAKRRANFRWVALVPAR
jgi:hypothetical protein